LIRNIRTALISTKVGATFTWFNYIWLTARYSENTKSTDRASAWLKVAVHPIVIPL